MGGQLSMRYESKTKGMEKIVAENERLRKELKKVEPLYGIFLHFILTCTKKYK